MGATLKVPQSDLFFIGLGFLFQRAKTARHILHHYAANEWRVGNKYENELEN